MGFTKFTKNVLNVSALPDRVQNQSSALKLVFDQAGVDIKTALNALISELEAKNAATNIGADVASVTEKTLQGILTAYENEIANRYTKAETNNAILADTNELIADVKIDLATGLLTVTKKNGTKQTFETSTEAESYAVGGTGTRPGEDTDNAKYYAQIAKQVAGGDFVTVVEMEGYAQKKGVYPTYEGTVLEGEVIETETTLEAESTLKLYGNSTQDGEPSPANEIPIMSVKSKSDNLFDMDSWSIFDKQNDGSYKSNVLVSIAISKINIDLPIGTYTLSYSIKSEAGTNYRIFIYYEDGTYASQYVGSTGEYIYASFTTENKKISYISLGYTAASENVYIKNLMLNKGTVALPYQPYGYVPVEARVEGKNLFDQSLVKTTGITKKLETGFRIQKNGDNRNGQTYTVPLKAGSYKFVGRVETDVENAGDVTFAFVFKDGTTAYKQYSAMFSSAQSFSKDINYFRPYFQASVANGKSFEVTDFMILRAGETDTSYEKGGIDIVNMPLGDIELRSTPDGTRDTFARVDGAWNKVNNVGKYSLTNAGDIRINEYYSGENCNCFFYNKTSGTWAKSNGYSERFKIIATSGSLETLDEPIMYLGGGTNKQVFIKVKNNITTVDEFKSQIVNTPIDVIVPLATPTYTPITDPALISALDELEQLILHKGYNRITVTGVNGVKAYLELEIAPTALLTNISETESGLNMPVPVVSEAGDVLVKVPKAENQMTINPATGVVNVKGLTINGVSLDAYIRSIIG